MERKSDNEYNLIAVASGQQSKNSEYKVIDKLTEIHKEEMKAKKKMVGV